MQNKKPYIIIAFVILIVAAAAFVGGRLLNGQAGALGFLPFGNGDQMMTVAINMTPAPELPTTQPEATGTFVERKDNTLTLQTISMEAGSGGGIVVSVGSASGEEDSGPVTSGGNAGPKVEVVVTKETKIYRDATEVNPESAASGETQIIQQVVEAGSLDDLNNQTMIMVWGRKNGDRIIADIISYSNPVIFKRP